MFYNFRGLMMRNKSRVKSTDCMVFLQSFLLEAADALKLGFTIDPQPGLTLFLKPVRNSSFEFKVDYSYILYGLLSNSYPIDNSECVDTINNLTVSWCKKLVDNFINYVNDMNLPSLDEMRATCTKLKNEKASIAKYIRRLMRCINADICHVNYDESHGPLGISKTIMILDNINRTYHDCTKLTVRRIEVHIDDDFFSSETNSLLFLARCVCFGLDYYGELNCSDGVKVHRSGHVIKCDFSSIGCGCHVIDATDAMTIHTQWCRYDVPAAKFERKRNPRRFPRS